jgi:hypothetical protein
MDTEVSPSMLVFRIHAQAKRHFDQAIHNEAAGERNCHT